MAMEVAAAETATMTSEPSVKRHQKRFGFGAGSWSPDGGGLLKTGSTTVAQSSSLDGIERKKVSSVCR